MNDSAIFQGLARAMSSGTPPMAWPMTIWKTCFFDTPLAVASHLQQFAGRQMQEQVQLLSDISKEGNPSAALSRQAAFVQQSALAWSNELLEVGELVQSRLLNAAQADTPAAQPETPFARAA